MGCGLRAQVIRLLEENLGAFVASCRTAWGVRVLMSLTIGKVVTGRRNRMGGAEKDESCFHDNVGRYNTNDWKEDTMIWENFVPHLYSCRMRLSLYQIEKKTLNSSLNGGRSRGIISDMSRRLKISGDIQSLAFPIIIYVCYDKSSIEVLGISRIIGNPMRSSDQAINPSPEQAWEHCQS